MKNLKIELERKKSIYTDIPLPVYYIQRLCRKRKHNVIIVVTIVTDEMFS